jgi:hypothetical protein
MANCSHTGYCYDFKVYEGAGDVFPEEPQEWIDNYNLGERVVMNFASVLPPQSHIFTDRFFTTPRLCSYLKTNKNQTLTGTLMRNKPGVDKSILFKKSKKTPRGFYKWSVDHNNNRLTQVCWMDRSPVSLLSSSDFGPDRCSEGISRLTLDDRGIYKRKPMRAPFIAQLYNLFMGGTDRYDRLKLNRSVCSPFTPTFCTEICYKNSVCLSLANVLFIVVELPLP